VKFVPAPDEPCPPHAAAARGRGAAINLKAFGNGFTLCFRGLRDKITSTQGLIPANCRRLYVWYGDTGE